MGTVDSASGHYGCISMAYPYDVRCTSTSTKYDAGGTHTCAQLDMAQWHSCTGSRPIGFSPCFSLLVDLLEYRYGCTTAVQVREEDDPQWNDIGNFLQTAAAATAVIDPA
jgi:hypothetical protein